MTIIQAIILGILQGATEFLPVSSSAHLVLVPWLMGWDPPVLTFDTTLHLGTLLAVLIYFRRDVWAIILGVLKTLKDRNLADPWGRLGWLVALGTIPAGLAGVFLDDFFEGFFSGSYLAVSVFLLITGVILFVSERIAQKARTLEKMTWLDAALIGVAQAVAILPGISRSGATIATGLGLGFTRTEAARFSFLLSMPIIFSAGILQLLKLITGNGGEMVPGALLVAGFIAAALSGYACIRFLMDYVRSRSLYIFSIYCWVFGLFCLVVALVRN